MCPASMHRAAGTRCSPARFLAPAAAEVSIVEAPAAPAAAAAAATTASESTFRFWTRLVDDERPAVHLLLMELGDGLLGFFVRAHLDEREASRTACRHVAHHADGVHLAGPAEQFRELIFRRGIRKVADVESPAHAVTYSCPRQPGMLFIS